MRLTATVLMFLLLTEAAHAAMWRMEEYCPAGRKGPYCDPGRKAKQRDIDNAYQKQIKSQPAPAATNDPWGDLRGSGTTGDKPKNGPRTR